MDCRYNRLLIASQRRVGESPIECDDEALEVVRRRCIAQFGEIDGVLYFHIILDTLPDRHPDLFPELADFPK